MGGKVIHVTLLRLLKSLTAMKTMANAHVCRSILEERCGASCLHQTVSQTFRILYSKQLALIRYPKDESLTISPAEDCQYCNSTLKLLIKLPQSPRHLWLDRLQ